MIPVVVVDGDSQGLDGEKSGLVRKFHRDYSILVIHLDEEVINDDW